MMRQMLSKTKRESISRFSLPLVVLILILLSAFLVIGSWADRSISGGKPEKHVQEKHQDGKILFVTNTTFVIENYFPFQNYGFDIKLQKQIYSRNSDGTLNEEWEPDLDPSEATLTAENINISSWDKIATYGSIEISSEHYINPIELTGFNSVALSKTIVTFNWTYEKPEGFEGSYYFFTVKAYEWGTSPFYPYIQWMRNFYHTFPLNEIGYHLFSIAVGFFFGWFALRKKSEVKEAYRYLSTSFNAGEQEPLGVKLLTSLKNLRYFPNQMGALGKIVFGPSIFLFRIYINNLISERKKESAFYGKKSVVKAFSLYPEDKISKIQDFVPELRTVVLVLGFLTSIGLSFSWNLDALTPLIYSLGLFYVFINIGATIYLVGKSKKDLIWIIISIVTVILALYFQEIINSLRFWR